MNVAFRVDASKEIGIGHLMRCLALSEELKKQGCNCYILSQILDEELLEKIQAFGVEFFKIKSNDEVISFSKKNDVKWIITDSYDLSAKYIKNLKKEGFKVLSIDDNAIIHYHSDIVINQNIGSEKLKFSGEEYTKFLLGPDYAILRDELLIRNEKNDKQNVEKILVTLGGTDSNNLTLKILQELEEIDGDYEVIVVVGILNKFYDDLKEFAEKSKTNFKILKSPENIAELYLETDAAISAGGTTCYELAYFGIPNLIVTIVDNQINSAKSFNDQKISIYLGHNSIDSLKDKIKEAINNHSLRKTLKENGKRLVDGQGKKRIIESMGNLT